jgi:cytochrome c-type biogenesis protein CcmF
MFWVFLLSIFGSSAIYVNRERHRELIPLCVTVISTVQMFFLFLMVVHNNPFATFITTPPADGNDSIRRCKATGWSSIRRRSTPALSA